jgi:hypothetical protein
MGKGQVKPSQADLTRSYNNMRAAANSEVSVKKIKKVQDIIINKEKVPEETKEQVGGSTGESPGVM